MKSPFVGMFVLLAGGAVAVPRFTMLLADCNFLIPVVCTLLPSTLQAQRVSFNLLG
jgi:hypothetical protein